MGENMSDDKTNRGPQDRARINVNEDYERKYWAKQLGISEETLRELVKQHGPSVEKVKTALGLHIVGSKR
jgi:hypothetical protein